MRGFPTAYLDVCPGELIAYPNGVARLMRARWDIHYRSATAVIERLRPFGGVGVLVDFDGQLGRVAVTGVTQVRPGDR